MWTELINMTVFLDELTRYFGIHQHAIIHTDCPVYLKRGSEESVTDRLKYNTINAIFLEFPKEHLSSIVKELYKIGDISLSVFFRWTPKAQLVCFIFCGMLSRSSR